MRPTSVNVNEAPATALDNPRGYLTWLGDRARMRAEVTAGQTRDLELSMSAAMSAVIR